MRTQILALLVVVTGSAIILATAAQSQSPKNVIALQGSSPGISQSGHANISGIFIAGAFAGNGVALTNLNADNIASGTVSAARLPTSLAYLIGPQTFTGVKTFSATAAFTNASAPFTVTSNSLVSNLNADLIDGLDSTAFASLSANQTWSGANTFTNASNSFTGIGTGLTALNASNITSGTVFDGRLSTNVALLPGTQLFSGAKTFSNTANFSNASMPFTVTSSNTVINLNADKLDGFNSTDFARLNFRIQSIGSSIAEMLYVENTSSSNVAKAIAGVASSATGNVWGLYGETNSDAGTAIRGYANAVSGTTYGGSFTATSPLGRGISAIGGARGVFGSSTEAGGYGVEGVSNGSTGYGVVGRVWTGSTSSATYGGYFENLSGLGGGVKVVSDALYGVKSELSGAGFGSYALYGSVTSNVGIAVYGTATSTSGATAGGTFLSSSTDGMGVSGHVSASTGITRGGYFSSSSNAGRGVEGVSTNSTAGTGGYFEAAGSGGRGIQVFTTHSSGSTYGIYLSSASLAGTGVYSISTATTGNTIAGHFRNESDTGTAVYGYTTRANAKAIYGFSSDISAGSTPYGVYGFTSAATLGSAVHAQGDMTATGVKPFRIDHPHDPLNKYLFHYASESPFPQNFYNGNVTTDSKGYAWVELPDYFEDINTNFKYQLTVMGETFAQAIVSKKIAGNRFQIRTNQPNTEVSWMVFADRNDARVQFKRPTDVRDKAGRERGKYQHPEYYGAPASMGVDYVPTTNETQRPR